MDKICLTYNGFDWDHGNVDKNLKKHGITCEDIEEVFRGVCFIYPDSLHSTEQEKRYLLFGELAVGQKLFVAFTLRKELVRAISARPMSQKEREFYEKEREKIGL